MESNNPSDGVSSVRCMLCGQPMAVGTVHCLDCGLHHVPDYHASVGKPEPESRRRGRRRILAWLWACVILVVAVPFATAGILLLFRKDLAETAYYEPGVSFVAMCVPALWVIGFAMGAVAYLWLLKLAFADNPLQGFLGLLCGIYMLVYGILFAKEEGTIPLYLLAGNMGLALLAYALSHLVQRLT